jgi:DNA invertase Pin-like site-specific DNA recombinase
VPSFDQGGNRVKVGYARVSTKRQRFDLQHRALADAGCAMIVSEIASGKNGQRPGLATVLAALGSGDQLVVWKIDRLGRDPFELMDLARMLRQRGIALAVLAGQAAAIDISTREGLALFAIYAGNAAIETETTAERSRAGVDAARTREATRRRPDRRRAVKRHPQPALEWRRLRCVFNRMRA